jgi:hypothetical protein
LYGTTARMNRRAVVLYGTTARMNRRAVVLYGTTAQLSRTNAAWWVRGAETV